MKIWREKCIGIGRWIERVPTSQGIKEIECKCEMCQGKGYTDEHESVSMSFEGYKKLKLASSKWKLIEWALENQIKFIAVPYDKDKPWATHINNDDIEFLKELKKEK